MHGYTLHSEVPLHEMSDIPLFITTYVLIQTYGYHVSGQVHQRTLWQF